VVDGAQETWDPSRTRSLFIEAAVIAWGVFVITTIVVWVRPNFWLDRVLAEWIDTEFLTRGPLSFLFAHLGAAPIVTPFVIAACAYFVLRWRAVIPAVILAVSYGLVGVIVTLFKELLRRPEPHRPDLLGYSFPSGHAGAATVGWFGFAVTWWILNRMAGSSGRQRLWFVISGSIIGVIWLMMLLRAAHWLTDMIAGTAIGIGCLGAVGGIVLTPAVSRAILRITPRPFRTPIRRGT
jgi:membrane-associated phospholipid phosphatase